MGVSVVLWQKAGKGHEAGKCVYREHGKVKDSKDKLGLSKV